MRITTSSLIVALLLSVAAVPTADAWIGSSLKASVTKFDVRASARAKRAAAKKVRPASVELPAAAKGGLLWGSAEATTTIVMFTDIECPFCQRFHQKTFRTLQKDYIDTNQVRFVVRHFPLSFHRNALNAAKAVVCARSQGDAVSRPFYERLVAQQNLELDAILGHAEAHELDVDALTTCMAAESTQKTIDTDIAAGTAAKVSGTPSFLIIGPTGVQKQISGAYPIDTFREAIGAVQPTK